MHIKKSEIVNETTTKIAKSRYDECIIATTGVRIDGASNTI